MTVQKKLFYVVLAIFLHISCNAQNTMKKTEQDWKKILSEEEFHVLREKGTERPYSGKYEDHNEAGTYVCKGCQNPLFISNQKFDAGCGWPSFYDVTQPGAVVQTPDYSHGMIRTEVTCQKCGGHLGHVFNDGPNPTGLRYCINSVSLDFTPLK